MANRKITLKDSTGTDNLYPATFTSQVFNEDGENVDTLITDLSDDVGDLSNLTTTDKTNLVSAINEVKNNIGSNVVKIAEGSFIGKKILTRRNDQLTFSNGVATKDISSNYSGSEAFGFFMFPYNANEVGLMHIIVNNGVATFNTEGTSINGQRYVNWLILLP